MLVNILGQGPIRLTNCLVKLIPTIALEGSRRQIRTKSRVELLFKAFIGLDLSIQFFFSCLQPFQFRLFFRPIRLKAITLRLIV